MCHTHARPPRIPTHQTPKVHMTTVIKLVILNINGITTRNRVGMLKEYIRCHDLDIVVLQEITSIGLFNMLGYDIYYNVGTHMRGTAIVTRNEHFKTTDGTVNCRGVQRDISCWQIRPIRDRQTDWTRILLQYRTATITTCRKWWPRYRGWL
jgi:exonuclease III